MEQITESKPSFLEQDPEIPNQSYCLFSFVPRKEDMTEKFNIPRFERIQKALEKNSDVLAKAIESDPERMVAHIMTIVTPVLTDVEKAESEKLHQANGGVKFRGTFRTMEEAQKYSKYLQELDSRFDIYLGQTGYWYPFDPPRDLVQKQEYKDEQLNALMQGYLENKAKSEVYFKKRMREMMEKKMEEKARKEIDGETSDNANGLPPIAEEDKDKPFIRLEQEEGQEGQEGQEQGDEDIVQ